MTFRPAAEIGMPLAAVDTPCLILEMDAFERNLRRLPESLRATGIRLRPHAKSHKCPEIALRQVALGAVGVCCQKVSEAEALVAGGISDVLISNEVVGDAKIERLVQLARRARIAVCADDAGNAAALDAAARDAGIVLDVLVEVDVGSHRCGVQPGAPAVALAQRIAAHGNLRFAGLQAYQGAAQHVRRVDERREAIARAVDDVQVTVNMLAVAGLDCSWVTGAGTGSYMFEATSRAYHELQAGSYIFMDADYARNEWTESGIPAFEHSLFVWTTVMSKPSARRAVVDAGLKASSIDSGMPRVADHPRVEFVKASDEHGVLELDGTADLRLGSKLRLIPGHCDPTVNLYDWFVCIRNGYVEALWPITARGALL